MPTPFAPFVQGDLFLRTKAPRARQQGMGLVVPPVPAVLEQDLTNVRPPVKGKQFEPQDVLGEVRVLPITAPSLQAMTAHDALARLTSRDKLRPNLMGIYEDGARQQRVATNGHGLAVLPDKTLSEKNRIVNTETGAVVNDRYPDYEFTIPLPGDKVILVTDVGALRNQLAGVLKASRFVQGGAGQADKTIPHIRAEIQYGQEHYYYDALLLAWLVDVLVVGGAQHLRVFLPEKPQRALLLQDAADPRRLAVLMPVINNGNVSGGPSLTTKAATLPHATVLRSGKAVPPPRRPTKGHKGKLVKKKEAAADVLRYFNSEGKLVDDETGKIDPEKLYYVQPDGSYEQGGDRRSPGWIKPPKAKKEKAKTPKAKGPRAKKEKPEDTRRKVPHLSNELTLMRSFLALTEKPVTVVQVRNLHRKLEKAIVGRKVRIRDEHAGYIRDMAELIAKTYAVMTDPNDPIASIKKLELRPDVVAKIRAEIEGTAVSSAVNLLSRFINLQGSKPEATAVATLLKSLEKEQAEHPSGPYATAVAGAVAVLRDWQPARVVRITAQQLGALSGLAGLGCACQEAKKKGGLGRPRKQTAPASRKAPKRPRSK